MHTPEEKKMSTPFQRHYVDVELFSDRHKLTQYVVKAMIACNDLNSAILSLQNVSKIEGISDSHRNAIGNWLFRMVNIRVIDAYDLIHKLQNIDEFKAFFTTAEMESLLADVNNTLEKADLLTVKTVRDKVSGHIDIAPISDALQRLSLLGIKRAEIALGTSFEQNRFHFADNIVDEILLNFVAGVTGSEQITQDEFATRFQALAELGGHLIAFWGFFCYSVIDEWQLWSEDQRIVD